MKAVLGFVSSLVWYKNPQMWYISPQTLILGKAADAMDNQGFTGGLW